MWPVFRVNGRCFFGGRFRRLATLVPWRSLQVLRFKLSGVGRQMFRFVSKVLRGSFVKSNKSAQFRDTGVATEYKVLHRKRDATGNTHISGIPKNSQQIDMLR